MIKHFAIVTHHVKGGGCEIVSGYEDDILARYVDGCDIIVFKKREEAENFKNQYYSDNVDNQI